MYKTIYKCILLLCAVCPLFAYGGGGLRSSVLDEALSELDQALDARSEILHHKDAKIDSLKLILGMTENYASRISVMKELINEYTHFNVDSLKRYYGKAVFEAWANGDSITARRLRIAEIADMPVRGEIHEVFMRIDSIDVNSLDENEKMLFFEAARWACLVSTSIYSPHKLHRGYFSKFCRYNDSIMVRTAPGAPRYRLLEGVHHLSSGRISLAVAALNDYLEDNNEVDMDQVNALSMLALAYFERSRKDQWLYYMVLAATVDARMGVLDSDALRQVSGALYLMGDINKAYQYIAIAQEDVSRSDAYIRSLNVAPVYPKLASDIREMQHRHVTSLYVIIASLVVIAVLCGVIIRIRYRDIKRLNRLKSELVNANTIKDAYMGRILSLCSIYMEKLDDYNRMVSRKITAGQIDDLYKLVKSGRFLEDQSKMFYEVFDKSFVHMFPSFVDDVNALLEPDKAIDKLIEPVRLTPELRILAFMRLGLDDSAQIARFLGLSLNTVYTYRNRMKSRAKNRLTFENDIMSIGVYH